MPRPPARFTSPRPRHEGNGGTIATSRIPRAGVLPGSLGLFATRHDLTEATRVQVTVRLAQVLADCLDLQSRCKQAHWNVKGPHFMQLHLLFDQVNEAVEGYADAIAERIVQLGGVVEGTVRAVAALSTLPEHPLTLSTGHEHIAALAESLAHFARGARGGIGDVTALNDAVSADILTEVTRGTDQWLWFVEAHEQARTR